MDGFSSAKKVMAGIFFAVFIGILFFTFWPLRIKETENKNISKIRERKRLSSENKNGNFSEFSMSFI